MMLPTLSERFEVAYNQIHIKLKEIIPSKNDSFVHLLDIAKLRHPYINNVYDRIKQYAKLRNSIVHYKLEPMKYIAEPHLDIVEDIEKISQMLSHPPLAIEVASTPVQVFQNNSKLLDIITTFSVNAYSQIPIYDENMNFSGLLTEGGIIKWISRNILEGNILINDVTAEDVLQVEQSYNVHFLAKTTTIFDLHDIFEKAFYENRRLEAIIMTENGSTKEKPIGIITSWDLIQTEHPTYSLVENWHNLS